MFHFARAKIVQEWSPLLVFFEVFGHMPGKEDVPGVAAIHYSLRHVDSSAGEIGSFVYIDHPAHGSTVNPHPKLQVWMFLECAANLHGALRRRLWTGVKDQRHPVAGRDFKQTARGFGFLELLGRPNNLV
ncbi:MAG TPA: hypothetical protein VHQ95_11695 [Pyrinomonadaceae bacterium]|nr:hypothetical protein [Pyrinomonadaceae bacterium]